MLGRVFFVALGLVAAVGTAAIYGLGALFVVDGDITSGTLVALAALVTRVYQPLTGLTNARVDLMTSMVSFERVFEVLDAPEPIVDRPGAVDLVDCTGRVTLDSVVFRYPARPEQSALDHFSAAIAPGEAVALVGPSGAGKTTVLQLLLRFYDPQQGRITLDRKSTRLNSSHSSVSRMPSSA